MHASPRDEEGDTPASLLPLPVREGSAPLRGRIASRLRLLPVLHSDLFQSLVQVDLPVDCPMQTCTQARVPNPAVANYCSSGASAPSALFSAAGYGRSDRLRLQLHHVLSECFFRSRQVDGDPVERAAGDSRGRQ